MARLSRCCRVKISPEVSGEIIELPVKEGQNVKKGDLLFRKIKPDDYLAASNSASASFSHLAEANKGNRDGQPGKKAHLEFWSAARGFSKKKLISDSDYFDAGEDDLRRGQSYHVGRLG